MTKEKGTSLSGAESFKTPVDSKLKGSLTEPKLRGTLIGQTGTSDKLRRTLIEGLKAKEIPKTPEDCIGRTFYLSDERGGKEAFVCERITPTKSGVMINLRSQNDNHTLTFSFSALKEKLESSRKLWTTE